MKPLASTVRVIEWEELPPRARNIPDNFNPLIEGILMVHQIECLKVKKSIFAIPKGRRTGITFTFGFEAVLTAAARKSIGGMDVYYIGDTKEKGLEFIGYCAKFSRTVAEQQANAVSHIEEFLFEDQDEHGNTQHITAYRIRYASGNRVVVLSSRPANIRGLQGLVIIDEAAFHQDVRGVLDAATALLIWGGRIVIISSHNGKSNPFNQFVNDIQNGLYGDDAVVYTVTFDDAVANGLYERVCWMKGEEPTLENKATWYARIRNAYGPRKAAMREELDVIPRDGNGICIPGVWIDTAMPPSNERVVLRLTLDDDFAHKPKAERESYANDWIERYLDPVLDKLDKKLRYAFGEDFARHRDFSSVVVMAVLPNLYRDVPLITEMHKVPTRQQEQILWHLIRKLRRYSGAMDATGPGQTLAEYTADEFGHDRIAQVNLNRAWYGMWMPKMIQGFEDGIVTLPADENVKQDLHSVEEIDGIPMVSPVRKEDLKDPELFRHGDTAIALALAWYASVEMNKGPVRAHSRGTRQANQILKGYQ
ncbi:Mu-like prophage FluMu protein gp28 [Yersinia pseudotuberculosis]|nr:hypothetical protein [Yersinia pseudotuberculosis]CNC37738.1 Mu-like prophage FluMu protein gp28 [Yersinia similis]CNK24053.1 Mu-like prophage FluMu protein gp28 [Yersinia pseudotuberculosis]CRY70837.1 Mu-like prophage FluMu protein gp28 [Yersinia pseudotuberculosis]SUQ18067.1 Mu-like prophage FluMu protein gp28 [Yersinia pseudotuberculosis]